jgi:hypothetical protein
MTTKAQLVKLLIQARRFNNQVVRDSRHMDAWELAVDRALEGEPGDDPTERRSTPERVAHRKLVDSLFTGRRM